MLPGAKIQLAAADRHPHRAAHHLAFSQRENLEPPQHENLALSQHEIPGLPQRENLGLPQHQNLGLPQHENLGLPQHQNLEHDVRISVVSPCLRVPGSPRHNPGAGRIRDV